MVTDPPRTATGTTTQWTTKEILGLTAADFNLVVTDSYDWVDRSRHPDFLTGAAMELGFVTGNGGRSSYSRGAAYDNWRISVTPEPATLSFLLLGGLAVLRRRNR